MDLRQYQQTWVKVMIGLRSVLYSIGDEGGAGCDM